MAMPYCRPKTILPAIQACVVLARPEPDHTSQMARYLNDTLTTYSICVQIFIVLIKNKLKYNKYLKMKEVLLTTMIIRLGQQCRRARCAAGSARF
jgi:hypothetical protein